MNKINLNYNPQGLIPAVLQDQETREILMVAWMNLDAFKLTFETGLAHFWSRSRNEIWKKGGTSGNLMHVKEIWIDCDQDTLLLQVKPEGPACHTGAVSCFFTKLDYQNRNN